MAYGPAAAEMPAIHFCPGGNVQHFLFLRDRMVPHRKKNVQHFWKIVQSKIRLSNISD